MPDEIRRCLEDLDESRHSILDEPPSAFDRSVQALAGDLMRASAQERAQFTDEISMRERMLVGHATWRMERLGPACSTSTPSRCSTRPQRMPVIQ